MQDATDMELLRQYANHNSDDAFATLVSRHVNLVYSAALRKTGNPHAAEEITQAVFIILAQKAGRIPEKTILPGWLYQTARLTAASSRKREIRRARREQEAYMQTEPHCTAPDETWQQLAPLLEDAMGQLGERDRAAVVLRFFGGKSFAEVATSSGINEQAAKKRVSRALDKLHRYFAKHGVRSTTDIIAGTISACSVQAAPAALAKSVTALAIAKGAAASGATVTLIKGALKLMAWSQAKTGILIGASAMVAAGTTALFVSLTPGFSQSAATAPQQVEISARFIDAAKDVLSAPKVTTQSGMTAQIRSTQDNPPVGGRTLPSGHMLDIKTEIIDGRISYSGSLTVRSKPASEEKPDYAQMAFSTTELLFSGVSDSGQQVQLEPSDGSLVELTLTIMNPDGTPATKN